MFQYAFFYCLQKNGFPVSFDISFYRHHNVHSGYELEKCFGIAINQAQKDHFSMGWKVLYSLMTSCNFHKFLCVEMENKKKHINIDKIGKNHILYGYWQSESYFLKYKEDIQKFFSFKNISISSKKIAEKMRDENSVAIHIRRGDFLQNSRFVDLSNSMYYKRAIAYVEGLENHPKYYIFSDDLEWCKCNMDFPNDSIFVSGNINHQSYEDMYLMSQAKIIILANSTFSWWSGYLGSHDYVVRPSKYHVEWTNEDDLLFYPKEWIRIDV